MPFCMSQLRRDDRQGLEDPEPRWTGGFLPSCRTRGEVWSWGDMDCIPPGWLGSSLGYEAGIEASQCMLAGSSPSRQCVGEFVKSPNHHFGKAKPLYFQTHSFRPSRLIDDAAAFPDPCKGAQPTRSSHLSAAVGDIGEGWWSGREG